MSDNHDPNNHGSDEEGSVEDWDYFLPSIDGTMIVQPWREEPYFYDHLPASLQQLSNPSTSAIVQPKPSPFTIPLSQPQASNQLNFLTAYSPENPTATGRADTFYTPPEDGRSVILAFHTSLTPTEPQKCGTDYKSEETPIETLFISAQLRFPVPEGSMADSYLWSKERRDEAALCINTKLGRLYSQGALSGCMAYKNFDTHARLMSGNGAQFCGQLDALLRADEALTPADDGPADPTSGPSTFPSKTPTHALITVGSDTFPLEIVQAAPFTGPGTSAWKEGQSYFDPDIPLKHLDKVKKTRRFNDNRIKLLQNSINESIERKSYESSMVRSFFGNVVLCGPDAPRTIASSSTAVAS